MPVVMYPIELLFYIFIFFRKVIIYFFLNCLFDFLFMCISIWWYYETNYIYMREFFVRKVELHFCMIRVSIISEDILKKKSEKNFTNISMKHAFQNIRVLMSATMPILL